MRPAWERRAASPAVGDAFSALPAAPDRALRGALTLGVALVVPELVWPRLLLWPVALLAGLGLVVHHRCRRPRDVVPPLVAGALAQALLVALARLVA